MAPGVLIEWRPEFELGLPGVDHEHRELIDMVNRLHQVFHAGRVLSLEDYLGELATRIAAHFALEELEMRERRYAGLAAHKADHERLLDEIGAMMEQAATGRGFNEPELACLLADWFGIHFRTHDADLHRALGHG